MRSSQARLHHASTGCRRGGISRFRPTRCCTCGSGWTDCPAKVRNGGAGASDRRTVRPLGQHRVRALKDFLKPRTAHRVDHGTPRLMPRSELERYCELSNECGPQ